ncbi:MAG: rhomboid family intramembrane serine protease [Chloroflexota bacterium]
MYPSQESQQPEAGWEYLPSEGKDAGRLNSALPKPPTYLPPPVPPAGSIAELNRPQRLWFRIPSEKPVLTLAILALLAAAFVLTLIVGGSLNASENSALLVRMGAKVNALVVEGDWWRLITATFLHAGYLHILLNGYALYIIGMDLEGFFGRGRFAAIYAISGLAGSVASFAFSPYLVPGVGASGAIFGLIGALAVYYGINRSLFGKLGQAQFWNIIIVILLNLGLGISGIFPIDNSAHIGGLIAGAAVGFVFCPRYRPGGWVNPLVREIVNTNKSPLTWLTAGMIALSVILLFFITLMLYTKGYLIPPLT